MSETEFQQTLRHKEELHQEKLRRSRNEEADDRMSLTQDQGSQKLRKWCLERAFETREMSGVAHMEVTNVADDYYQWIKAGHSQASRLNDG